MLHNAPLIVGRVVLAAALDARVECPELLAEALARAESGDCTDPGNVVWNYLRTSPPEPLAAIAHAVDFARRMTPEHRQLSPLDRASMTAASARVALVALGWTEDAARAALDRAVTTGELPTPKARA